MTSKIFQQAFKLAQVKPSNAKGIDYIYVLYTFSDKVNKYIFSDKDNGIKFIFCFFYIFPNLIWKENPAIDNRPHEDKSEHSSLGSVRKEECDDLS